MKSKWTALVLISIVFMALIAFCGGADGSVEPTMQADVVTDMDVGVGPGSEVLPPYELQLLAPMTCPSEPTTVLACFQARPDGHQNQRLSILDEGLDISSDDTNTNPKVVRLWRHATIAGSPLHRWIRG